MNIKTGEKKRTSSTKKEDFSFVLQFDRDSGQYKFPEVIPAKQVAQPAEVVSIPIAAPDSTVVKIPNKTRVQRTKKKEALATNGLQYAMIAPQPAQIPVVN